MMVSLASLRVLAWAQEKLASGVAPRPSRATAIRGRKKISRMLSTGWSLFDQSGKACDSAFGVLVRPHDLIGKACNFSRSCSERIRLRLDAIEQAGQRADRLDLRSARIGRNALGAAEEPLLVVFALDRPQVVAETDPQPPP